MNGSNLGLRKPDPIDIKTIDDIALPQSVWATLNSASRDAGLTLGEAVAQIVIDRCAPIEVPSAPARAPRGSRKPKTT